MGNKSRKQRRAAQQAAAAQAELAADPPTPGDAGQGANAAAGCAGESDARAQAAPPAGSTVAASRGRLLSNAFIAAFLLYQLVMPLTYYLGDRGFDERFSWRMFSTVRMLSCQARVFETLEVGGTERERRVRVEHQVQAAWVNMLERFRTLVVRKVLERSCEPAGVVRTRFSLRCRKPDGSELPRVERHMVCAQGELREGRAP